MRASLLVLGASAALLVAGCQGKGVEEDDDAAEATISMSEVPPAVQASFEEMHPDATVHEVERETHADGTAEYEFNFTENGKKGSVELDDKGAVAAEDKD